MAATNTFSPDAVLGGPIVHALRGKLSLNGDLQPPCQIERGETLIYVGALNGRNTGGIPHFYKCTETNAKFFEDNDLAKVVVAAEAVSISKSEEIVSVPVVLGGRCMVTFSLDKKTGTKSFGSGEFMEGPPNFLTIHENNVLKPGKETTLDLFMQDF